MKFEINPVSLSKLTVTTGRGDSFEVPTMEFLRDFYRESLLAIPADGRITDKSAGFDFLETHGVAFEVRNMNEFFFLIFSPHTRNLKFANRGGVVKDVDGAQIPECLLVVRRDAESKIVKNTWLYLLDRTSLRSPLSLSSIDICLRPWPHGNVYEHGRICWGQVPMKSLGSPQAIFDLFFNTEFNSDLVFSVNVVSLAKDEPRSPLGGNMSFRDAHELATQYN